MQYIRWGGPIFSGVCKMLAFGEADCFQSKCFCAVLSPNWHLLYLQRYLSRLASKHLFEADWNGFVWNRDPLVTLASYPWCVAIGCLGEKCSAKMLSVSFLSCCRLWFLEGLIRALEGPEEEEKTQTLSVRILVCHVHQWNSDSFLKSLSLGFLTYRRGDHFIWGGGFTSIDIRSMANTQRGWHLITCLRCLVVLGSLLES